MNIQQPTSWVSVWALDCLVHSVPLIKNESTSVIINSIMISIFSALCTMNLWNAGCQKNKRVVLLQSHQWLGPDLVWFSCGHINQPVESVTYTRYKLSQKMSLREWGTSLWMERHVTLCISLSCLVTPGLWWVGEKKYDFVDYPSLFNDRREWCSVPLLHSKQKQTSFPR